jgi:hypothetical protein
VKKFVFYGPAASRLSAFRSRSKRYLKLKKAYSLVLQAYNNAVFLEKTVKPLPASQGTFLTMFIVQYLRRHLKKKKVARHRSIVHKLHKLGLKYARELQFRFQKWARAYHVLSLRKA